MAKKNKRSSNEFVRMAQDLQSLRGGNTRKTEALIALAVIGGGLTESAAETSETIGRSTITRYKMAESLKGDARIAFDKTTAETDDALNKVNAGIAQSIKEQIQRH